MAVVALCDVNGAIKIGACNIYHGCVHNMLHEKSEDILRGLYKSASFVVQAIAFMKTGIYKKNLSKILLQDRYKLLDGCLCQLNVFDAFSLIKKMQNEIQDINFETWFEETKLIDINNNIARVLVPMPFPCICLISQKAVFPSPRFP